MSTRILVWNGTQFDTVDSDTVDGFHSTQLQGLNLQHCVAGATRPRHRGLTMFQCYNSNNTPEIYGNVLSLYGEGGHGGAGELFIGWSGGSTETSGAHAGLYVRSLRDVEGSMWSEWARVYTTAYKPTPEDIGAVSMSNGKLKCRKDKWFRIDDPDSYGIHMNNSDLIGVNSIVFCDDSNATMEGLCFPKSNIDLTTAPVNIQNYDIVRAMDGVFYFNDGKIYHEGYKPTPAAIGAIPLSGSTGISGTIRTSGEIQSTNVHAFRAVHGNYGYFIRNDGANIYHMLTNSGDQYGTYNSLRPLTISCHTGDIVIGHALTIGNSNGNVKRTTISTASPSGGANGDVWIKYS